MLEKIKKNNKSKEKGSAPNPKQEKLSENLKYV
jgi:hypothetical protein